MTNPASDPPPVIVVRQTFGDSKDNSRSPDIIVAPGTEFFDTDMFVDELTFDWNFGQVPALGAANVVYVRGRNYNPKGNQNATVYLYAVTSDKLLDPTAWSADGFSGGSPKNSAKIKALLQYGRVATLTPVQWAPPTPASGVHYLLISWIDNSAHPTPPTFPTKPFEDRDALSRYVTANPQLAVLDTSYDGVFMRQFPGQTPTQNGTGARTSPDIIISGTAAAQDASAYSASVSYDSTTLNNTAGFGSRNFVYLRAVNTSPGPASARVYLYWTTQISPPSWNDSGFSVAGKPQNWVDLKATRHGEVMVSTLPLVWDAPPVSGDHALIAYVDTSPHPDAAPDFTPFDYLGIEAVKKFVSATPRLAWVALAGQRAPAAAMTWQQVVQPQTAEDLFVGVEFTDIPVDGSFSLSVPGPDAANTIVVTGAHIPHPNAFVAWPVSYPAGFATSAVLTYVQGATAPSGSPKIVLRVIPRPAGE